jgi:D-glycero-D-manno-heptose 1,7-bisphosphate phosphatase
MAGHKAAFLDRDGTLIRDEGYIADPDLVQLLDGVVDGLVDLRRRGYLLIVVTNQSGIGNWQITKRQYDAVTRRMVDLLARHSITLTAIYHCPHTPRDACPCRKPAPGMFHRAVAEHGVDLTRSIMFGDKPSDVIAEVPHNVQVPKDASWRTWYAAATLALPRP